MNTVLFVVSHFGSGSDSLVSALNANPRVQFWDMQITYSHPLDLSFLLGQEHKLKNSAAIYADHLLINPIFSCKPLYKLCNFIYVVRDAKSSLNCMTQRTGKHAAMYYRYRLRRICEMAKRTPGAVLLTYDELQSGKGLDLIEEYLQLKTPLSKPQPSSIENDDFDVKTCNECQDIYERYLYYLKQLNLKQVAF